MERASVALSATDYFEAAALSLKALRAARRERDYERMARICLPLQEARRQVRERAVDRGRVYQVRSLEAILTLREAGCYLVEPPLVGIDANLVRSALWNARVVSLVLAREPETVAGLWPLVATGGGEGLPVVMRVRLPKPQNAHASSSWLVMAQERLGDEAVSQVLAHWPADHRVDDLLERLEGVPDHEKLLQALEKACREAARLSSPSPPRRRPPLDDLFGI